MSKMRSFSPEFKVQRVLELLGGGSPGEICRQHQIKDSLLYRWKQEFLERAPLIYARGGAEASQEQARIAELEQMIGRLTMELAAAKKVFGLAGSRARTSGR